MLDHAAFIAARRLDTDARGAGLGQIGYQNTPAGKGLAAVQRSVRP